MNRSVRTTSINVRVSDGCVYLGSHYDLVCYSVPESFKSENNRYDKLHVEVKSQLSHPYYFLPHALLIYVLYPKATTPSPLTLSFLSGKELEYSHITFDELELHVLLKLLFADYFRRPAQGTFVSQGVYYVYVKPEHHYRTGELKWDMCLEIKVNGHRKNKGKEATEWQSFQISNSATRFRIADKSRIKDWQKNINSYFHKTSPQDGIVYFNQLRKEEIDTFEGEIYEIYRDKKRHAQLDYHNHRNPEQCRGKVLYDFISRLIEYLNGCGLEAQQQYRQVGEFPASKAFGELSLAHLPTVNVLDERVNTDNPIEDYVELLQAEYPEVKFELIDGLSTESRTPTLILIDGTQEDFADGGILSDFGNDPYQTIYRTEDNISIPKQSVNINLDGDGWKGEDPFEYLEYSIVSFTGDEGATAKYKFDVALKELLQKDIVINPRNVVDILPGYSNNDVDLRRFAFVRNLTYTNIGKHKVLLYFADEELHFVDLRSSSSKQTLYKVADSLGLDWDDVETALSEKNYDKEPSEYDVILSDGLAIHVEDISETVLYEYDEIITRQSIRQDQFLIDYFRLQHRYNDAKSDTWLTLEELQERGLLDGQAPKTMKERVSIDFYNQLGTFDEFLDDLKMNHIEISYDTLTNETNMETIGTIFNLKRSEKTNKYSNRRLRNIYKRLGMFAGDKEKDVHLYQGIWYDAEHRFMVGAKQGLNETQPNAHRIRQFDILVGNGQFEIELMLQTMAVAFVRHKQYTVMPYLFHLIDIYVENVLRWQDD
jgi:hypothetical protein